MKAISSIMPIKNYKYLLKISNLLNILILTIVFIVVYFISPYFELFHNDIDSAKYMFSVLVKSEDALIALLIALILVFARLTTLSYPSKLLCSQRFLNYIFLSEIIIIFSHIIFYHYKFLHTHVDSARYMLSALVQSEAAIFAIVITLTLVAVQLTAVSYSARVIEIFKKMPDFWILFLIYGFAMFWGLGVLKLIDKANPQINNLSNLEIHISFAYYMGIVAFVALVPYFWNTFELLKPSSIINQLAEKLTKDEIFSSIMEVEISSDPNNPPVIIDKEKDPIQPIIDIMRIALERNDSDLIRDALKAINRRTNIILESKNLKKEDEIIVSTHIFHQLIKFGKLTARKNDEESTSEVITNLRKIGIKAADLKLEYATGFSIHSLIDIGKVTTKLKLEESTQILVQSVGAIGTIAVLQNLKTSSKNAAFSLGLLGKAVSEQELGIVLDEIIFFLDEIGKASALSKLEETTLQTEESLKIVILAAIEQKSESRMLKSTKSLGWIGELATENKLQNAAIHAVDFLGCIGEAAIEKKHEELAQQVTNSLRLIKIISTRQQLEDISQKAEILYTKISKDVDKLRVIYVDY